MLIKFASFPPSLLVVFFALISVSAQTQLIINEIVSYNTEHPDEFGQFPDWVEVTNLSAEEVDLGNYYLSDDADNLLLWNLPDIELQQNSFAVFFGSKDTINVMHFPFNLSGIGETVYLTHEDDGLIDQVTFPHLEENNSYGLPIGESTFKFFQDATPDSENNTPYFDGYAPPPTPSLIGGAYGTGSILELLPPNTDGAIYFTDDGRIPTEAGSLYTEPILLDSITVIKSIFVQDNFLPSLVRTDTYFTGEISELPIISISVDHDSLFDPIVGLYMEGPNAEEAWPHWGANYWADKEIRVAFEYFEEGVRKASQDVGLEIHGGKSSRNKPQRPFRLVGKSKYGKEFIEYAFFDDKPHVNKFKHLVLRNSGADFLKTNFRDGFWHKHVLNEDIDFEVFGFQPCAVYLNGEYWGIMSIREKVSQLYAGENVNIEPDSVIIGEIENVAPFVGDTIHYYNISNFIIEQDMSLAENFAYVETQIDMTSYADYYILQIFAGNPDWPANNIKFWKPGITLGKWRYIMFDLDTTMMLYNWIVYEFDMFDWVFREKHAALNSKIFVNLLENDEFRRIYINRFADLMNTKLSDSRLTATLDQVVEMIEPEIEAHYSRWDGDLDYWQNEVDHILPGFNAARQPHVRDHIVLHFELEKEVELQFETFPQNAGSMSINTIVPGIPFSGYYFSGNPIDVTITPNLGFEFSHWTFSEHWVDNPEHTTIQQDFKESGTLTAVFKETNEELLYALRSPATGKLVEMVYSASAKCECKVQVIDQHGALVLDRTKYMEEGKNLFTLDLSEQTAGIYIVQVFSNEQHQSTKILVP